MADYNNASVEILTKLLEDKITLECISDWLVNLKDCAQYYGLIGDKEKLSQFQFIEWFLNDLRIKAGLVISERKGKIGGTSSAAVSANLAQPVECCNNSSKWPISNEMKLKTSEEVYLEEYPGLMELPSKKCNKSHRRIKPTSIRTDIECFSEKQLVEPVSGINPCPVPTSFNVSNKEELLIQRFSKKKKFKKSYSPLDITIAFSKKCNFTPFTLNGSRFINIDKLVNLYNTLLKNYLVPNLSSEIRFILSMFDQLTEHRVSFSKKHNSGCDNSFLSSVEEWEYFCIHVIIQQEHIISKLGSNVLKFIVDRLSLFTVEIPACYFCNNVDIIFVHSGFKFYSRIFTDNKMGIDDFSNESDFILICDQEKKILEIEKNWYSHRSEVRLGEEIKSLLDVSLQTFWFYFLGKKFVCCLIKKIEDQIFNGSDCEQKLAQLNNRLTKPSNENEPEISFHSNELFFKLWLDYCLVKCPLFIHYTKHWMIYALSALIKDTYKELVDSLCPDKRNTHLCTLKVKIILAKFLGYTEFYFNRHNYKLNGNERKQLITVQSEILPAFDIKKCLLEAVKNGTLVLTVPWIVEFLCMADNISALLPYYHDILFMLTTFYLSYCIRHNNKDGSKGPGFKKELLLKTSILIPQRSFGDENASNIEGITVLLNESSFIFLLVWIGRLFDSKILGESLFFDNALSYQHKISVAKFRSGQANWKTALDCADFVKRDVFIFCSPFFSKMKYWENSSSGYIRSIRPMPLDSEKFQGSPANIQEILETNFLSHHQSLANLISFISERIADLCQSDIAMILFPNKSTAHCPKIEKEKGLNYLNSEDSIFSCDSLHLMKPQILEIMNSCEIKIKNSFSLLAPPGLSSAVMEACIAIASKQLKRHIINWLINEGFSSANIEKNIITNTNLVMESCKVNDVNRKNGEPAPYNASLSSSLNEIHIMVRRIDKEKPIAHSFYSTLEKFMLISIQLKEINEKKLLKDLYILSWDYILLLVCNYDDIICDFFLTKMVNFWKENHYGNNEERILCPRTIKEASVKTEESQATIAKNLAKLMLFNLKDEIISPECFETQNVAVLRYTWTKVELSFIKTYMVTLCEYIKSTTAISSPRLLSILECIIDSVDDILSLESWP